MRRRRRHRHIVSVALPELDDARPAPRAGHRQRRSECRRCRIRGPRDLDPARMGRRSKPVHRPRRRSCLVGVRRRPRHRRSRPTGNRDRTRRRGPSGVRRRLRADPVRSIRCAVRRARLRRRRRRLGQGRDRGSGRQPEGAAPRHDPAPSRCRRAPRVPHRTAAAGDRVVRKCCVGCGNTRRGGELADRRLRAHLDE